MEPSLSAMAKFEDLSSGQTVDISNESRLVIGLTIDERLICVDNEFAENDCVIALYHVNRRNDGDWLTANPDLPCYVNDEETTGTILLSQGTVIHIGDKFIRYQLSRSTITAPPKPTRRLRQPSSDSDHSLQVLDEWIILDGDASLENIKTKGIPEDDPLIKAITSTEQLCSIVSSHISHQSVVYTDVVLTSQDIDDLFKSIKGIGRGNEALMRQFVLDYHARFIKEENMGKPFHQPVIALLTEFLKLALGPEKEVQMWLRLLAAYSEKRENIAYIIELNVTPVILGAMAAYQHSATIQKYSCTILSQVSSILPDSRQKGPMRESSVELVLMAVRRHMDNAEVVRPACCTLANITQSYAALIRLVLSPDVHDDSRSEDSAVDLLARWLGIMEVMQEYGLPIMATLLSRHHQDAIIQAECQRIVSFFRSNSFPADGELETKVKLPHLDLSVLNNLMEETGDDTDSVNEVFLETENVSQVTTDSHETVSDTQLQDVPDTQLQDVPDTPATDSYAVLPVCQTDVPVTEPDNSNREYDTFLSVIQEECETLDTDCVVVMRSSSNAVYPDHNATNTEFDGLLPTGSTNKSKKEKKPNLFGRLFSSLSKKDTKCETASKANVTEDKADSEKSKNLDKTGDDLGTVVPADAVINKPSVHTEPAAETDDIDILVLRNSIYSDMVDSLNDIVNKYRHTGLEQESMSAGEVTSQSDIVSSDNGSPLQQPESVEHLVDTNPTEVPTKDSQAEVHLVETTSVPVSETECSPVALHTDTTKSTDDTSGYHSVNFPEDKKIQVTTIDANTDDSSSYKSIDLSEDEKLLQTNLDNSKDTDMVSKTSNKFLTFKMQKVKLQNFKSAAKTILRLKRKQSYVVNKELEVERSLMPDTKDEEVKVQTESNDTNSAATDVAQHAASPKKWQFMKNKRPKSEMIHSLEPGQESFTQKEKTKALTGKFDFSFNKTVKNGQVIHQGANQNGQEHQKCDIESTQVTSYLDNKIHQPASSENLSNPDEPSAEIENSGEFIKNYRLPSVAALRKVFENEKIEIVSNPKYDRLKKSKSVNLE